MQPAVMLELEGVFFGGPDEEDTWDDGSGAALPGFETDFASWEQEIFNERPELLFGSEVLVGLNGVPGHSDCSVKDGEVKARALNHTWDDWIPSFLIF